jgi:hypothetical protein
MQNESFRQVQNGTDGTIRRCRDAKVGRDRWQLVPYLTGGAAAIHAVAKDSEGEVLSGDVDVQEGDLPVHRGRDYDQMKKGGETYLRRR